MRQMNLLDTNSPRTVVPPGMDTKKRISSRLTGYHTNNKQLLTLLQMMMLKLKLQGYLLSQPQKSDTFLISGSQQ